VSLNLYFSQNSTVSSLFPLQCYFTESGKVKGAAFNSKFRFIHAVSSDIGFKTIKHILLRIYVIIILNKNSLPKLLMSLDIMLKSLHFFSRCKENVKSNLLSNSTLYLYLKKLSIIRSLCTGTLNTDPPCNTKKF